MKKIIVIGAGPAGMMAAGVAAGRGNRVVLIEKNEKVGRKLAITGKGRCNITNACEVEELIANVPRNGKFLYSAIYGFTNQDVIAFFNQLGVPTKVERGGRVFPVSDKAYDVVDAMLRFLRQQKVKLIQAEVGALRVAGGAVRGVTLENGDKMDADCVLVATGGKSYPKTGSTGDGFAFARQAGHTITELSPSLVPLVSPDAWVRDLLGLSLKNVAVSVCDGAGRQVFGEMGEMLFTHFGFSGPVILSASAHMKQNTPYTLSIDLKPALDLQKLSDRILRDFEKFDKKHFQNALGDLLPQKLIPIVVSRCGIDPHKQACQISRKEREDLAFLLKHFTARILGFRPIEEAIVTSGGVKVSEVNPSTMESKKCSGLFFAGEVLDVNAYTGGFNLQIAFSTGHLAGESM